MFVEFIIMVYYLVFLKHLLLNSNGLKAFTNTCASEIVIKNDWSINNQWIPISLAIICIKI